MHEDRITIRIMNPNSKEEIKRKMKEKLNLRYKRGSRRRGITVCDNIR